MKNKVSRVLKNEKGLTLIELLAVIVILAIIAAIAIPAIGNIIQNQRDKAVLANASTIISGAKLAYADGACSKTVDATDQAAANQICDLNELKGYVDGVTLKTGDQVALTKDAAGNSVYTLRYTDFADIKTGSKYFVTGASITETALNALMGK